MAAHLRTALLASAMAGLALACGAARDARPRHLLLVSLDTVSALHVGAYGYQRDTTPVLDGLAARGALFQNALTPQPWTLTAHASLLTGLYPASHGAGKQDQIREGAVSLAQVLRASGFATAGYAGNVAWMRPRYGMARGFEHYRAGSRSPGETDRFARRFLEEQAALGSATRFFLFAHYYEAHSDVGTDVPYWAPAPYGLHFLGGTLDWEHRGDTRLLMELQGHETERDREVIRALYDGGVRYTDLERLGRLLAMLDETGLRDQTLVVVTSDHGEEMFEHGRCSHQQPYEEISRVPLVLAGPGVPAGLRLPQVVDLTDVAPTVLELLGIPPPPHLQGRSLVPLLRGGTLPERAAYVDGILGSDEPYLAERQSAATGWFDGQRFAYVNRFLREPGAAGTRVFQPSPDVELYRLDDDPAQAHDVADAYPEIATALEQGLLRWYQTNEALRDRMGPRLPVRAAANAAKEREHLVGLGYLEEEPRAAAPD